MSIRNGISVNCPEWIRKELIKGNDDPALSVYLIKNKEELEIKGFKDCSQSINTFKKGFKRRIKREIKLKEKEIEKLRRIL